MTHLNKQRLHNLANCTPIALQMKYVCRNLQESTRKHCGGFLPLFGGSHIKTCFYIRNKVQLDGISSLTADSQEVRRGRGEQIEENMKNIKSNSAHTAWKTPYTKPSSVLCERERERARGEDVLFFSIMRAAAAYRFREEGVRKVLGAFIQPLMF